ncbi:MAG: metalloregulator ArsR/SmtB family transcription factor [Chloroflexi bacterium]|nr:metalloregulator ArsR/SmtB family transcription factor [Chloroflexota bacterium]
MPNSIDNKRRQKETLYQFFAHIGKALSNPHRLELVDLLTQAPRTVEELAAVAHMSIANTSQHLQRLKQARLVLDEREGVYIRYRLADDAVARLWQELRAVTEQQMAEVRDALDAYRDRRYEFEQISMAELRQRLQNGDVVLIDVRPEVEYAAGHISGALSFPLEDMAQRLNSLPPDLPVVAYCRGPYCVLADQALALLTGRGRQVARLEEGVWEWQQAGYVLSD